jgi:eukaryotic-like serine/threonine-protein kinase
MTEDAIIAAALRKKDPGERAAFLDLVCAGEAALRARVEARIREKLEPEPEVGHTVNVGEAAYTTSDASADVATAAASKEGPGSLIGPYKLVQAIGAGGMGMVYLAEQTHPVRRSVALKIIKQGMDTDQVIARFEAERQALALMDHPNIAKVLDAGTTDSGRPYFVMELVKGVPITKYCDSNRLTVRERLELFVPVCQAIQHAHQKGIIHRDIKPSNVLVALYDAKPIPKVIDFGVAKATGQHLTEQTMFTQIGAVVGTLEYMSPEQAESTALDIDTRSDIYSLGALLYELLTGSTPLASADMRQAAYLEMLRKIREDEPPAPSKRVGESSGALQTTSQQRKTEPGKLPKMLQGELDWIVMKALEKDRTRRYETANGFARDIERYLEGDPVEAGPPSATYRLKKFASKNKVLIGTVSAFAALLVLGVVVSTWQAVRATRAERAAKAERDRADTEAATSRAITDFLQNSLLSQASAQQQSGLNAPPDPDVKVRTLLDRAAATIGEKFKDQPLVEAGVRSTIGMTYRDLNLAPQAEEQLQKAYDLSLKNRPADDPDTLQMQEGVAAIKWDEGKAAEALPQEKSAYEAMLRVLGPEDHRTLRAMQNLGVFYLVTNKYEEAEPLLKKALEIQIRTLGYDNQETLNTSDSLATLYRFQEKYTLADPLFAHGLESYRRVFGPNHPYTLREMYGLAVNDIGEGKYAEAEQLLLQVVEGNRQLLGDDHPGTIATRGALAQVYEKQGKYKDALALQEKVVDGDTRALGPTHPYTIVACNRLAITYRKLGQNAKAEELLSTRTAQALRTKDGENADTLEAMSDLVDFYHDEKKFDLAAAELNRIVEIDQRLYGPDDSRTIGDATLLGRDYLTLKKFGQAEATFRRNLASKEKTAPDSWGRFYMESLIGAALVGQKKYAEAEPLLVSGYEGIQQRETKLQPDTKKYLAETGERVVKLYETWDKPEKAAEWREKLKAGAPETPAAKPGVKQ